MTRPYHGGRRGWRLVQLDLKAADRRSCALSRLPSGTAAEASSFAACAHQYLGDAAVGRDDRQRSRTCDNGTLQLTYEPAGNPTYGDTAAGS